MDGFVNYFFGTLFNYLIEILTYPIKLYNKIILRIPFLFLIYIASIFILKIKYSNSNLNES